MAGPSIHELTENIAYDYSMGRGEPDSAPWLIGALTGEVNQSLKLDTRVAEDRDFFFSAIINNHIKSLGEENPLMAGECLRIVTSSPYASVRVAALESLNLRNFYVQKGDKATHLWTDLPHSERGNHILPLAARIEAIARDDQDEQVRVTATSLFVDLARLAINPRVGMERPEEGNFVNRTATLYDLEPSETSDNMLYQLVILCQDENVINLQQNAKEPVNLEDVWRSRVDRFIRESPHIGSKLRLIYNIMMSPYYGFQDLKFVEPFTLERMKAQVQDARDKSDEDDIRALQVQLADYIENMLTNTDRNKLSPQQVEMIRKKVIEDYVEAGK